MTKEEIIEAIANMTVIELSELVKAIEEKFGVSAAAPVAVAAGPAMAAGPAAPEEEEKTEFDVILVSAGDKKIPVLKVVRELTGLGLKEARSRGRRTEAVKKSQQRKEAEGSRRSLRTAGATVEINKNFCAYICIAVKIRASVFPRTSSPLCLTYWPAFATLKNAAPLHWVDAFYDFVLLIYTTQDPSSF